MTQEPQNGGLEEKGESPDRSGIRRHTAKVTIAAKEGENLFGLCGYSQRRPAKASDQSRVGGEKPHPGARRPLQAQNGSAGENDLGPGKTEEPAPAHPALLLGASCPTNHIRIANKEDSNNIRKSAQRN